MTYFLKNLIKLNQEENEPEIISIGHRNPQGLSYLPKENKIVLTEHGPMGGDEVNVIDLNSSNNEIFNFGWPIASYGEHYGGRSKENREKYLKYPLLKSHSKHGFIEPYIHFRKSIGISEIVRLKNNLFIFSSLKDKALYIFRLDEDFKNKDLDRVEIGERIRDIIFTGKDLFLFLEDSSSIGKINLKNINIERF